MNRIFACILVAAAGALALRLACQKDTESPESTPRASPGAGQASIAQDPRIEFLLAPCAKSETYDVNTSDPVAILKEMLLHGPRDTVNRQRR